MTRQHVRGFTIIEVIVIVIVIAILTSIGIFAYNQVQINARNNERASDSTQIINALEQYRREKGVYPSCSMMTQNIDSVATSILRGLNATALTAPTAASGTNSIQCTQLSASSPDVYAYVGNSGSDCSSGTFCYEYTLQYRQEGSGEIVSKESIYCQSGASSCERPAN